jgi:hypothetical protein
MAMDTVPRRWLRLTTYGMAVNPKRTEDRSIAIMQSASA